MSIKGMSYNKAIYGLTGGYLEVADVLRSYNTQRRKALKQIKEVQRSDVSFRRSENIPTLPTAAALAKSGSLEDIAHAVADVNRVLKTETVAHRRQQRKKALESLHEGDRWGFINDKNFNQFADFMEWFRENMVNQLLDSKDTTVQEFMRDRAGKKKPASQRSWARIFVKWLKDNGYDDEAQEVGSMFFASYRRGRN
jgi:hypothetical protein